MGSLNHLYCLNQPPESLQIENGIVAVTAYGLIDGMTLPLTFEIYKPKERLQEGDKYKTKPEIAAGMIRELQAMGFKLSLFSC